MKEYSSFETVKVSLAKELDGLDDEIDLGAGNWITFGYIPSNVQVFFALDNNSNSKIQAKQGLQIKVPHSKVYLWSTGTNATEEMEIMHWGSNDIEMIMPPRSDFDSLNGYGSLALSQLDKIINPFVFDTVTRGGGTYTALTTVLSKTTQANKIKFSAFGFRNDNYLLLSGTAQLYINGFCSGVAGGMNDSSGRDSSFIDIELNVNIGDTIEIKILSLTNHYIYFNLEEYKLK